MPLEEHQIKPIGQKIIKVKYGWWRWYFLSMKRMHRKSCNCLQIVPCINIVRDTFQSYHQSAFLSYKIRIRKYPLTLLFEVWCRLAWVYANNLHIWEGNMAPVESFKPSTALLMVLKDLPDKRCPLVPCPTFLYFATPTRRHAIPSDKLRFVIRICF